MRKDLERRIRKLEQKSVSTFHTRLRALARRLYGREDVYRRAVQGHESELDRELGPDGTITWPGFQLLYDLTHPARDPASAQRGGKQGRPMSNPTVETCEGAGWK